MQGAAGGPVDVSARESLPYGEEERYLETFAERGGDWPVVYDPEYSFSNDFGVSLVPETWIIDPSGVVQTRIISEVTAEGLGALINQMRGAAQ